MFEIFLLLLIPFACPAPSAGWSSDQRQGYAIVAVMAILAVASVVADQRLRAGRHRGTVPQAVGAAMEGKEIRFGVAGSATVRRRPPR